MGREIKITESLVRNFINTFCHVYCECEERTCENYYCDMHLLNMNNLDQFRLKDLLEVKHGKR